MAHESAHVRDRAPAATAAAASLAEPDRVDLRRLAAPDADTLLAVQRLAGNAAAVEALAAVPSAPAAAVSPLVVGCAHDPAERAADEAADRALSRLAPISDSPAVRRAAAPSAAGAVVGAAGGALDASTAGLIEAERGRGRALPAPVRREMEQAFGADFGGVRVHADARAGELNGKLGARAFTTGRDVFFGAGEYAPDTAEGRHVLAHELAHTVQEGATARRTVRRWELGARNLDLKQAKKVKTVPSGQAVFFLEDPQGDLLVVKGDDIPAGMLELVSQIHETLDGKATVKTRPLGPAGKQQMMDLLDDPIKCDPTSFKKLYDTDKSSTVSRIKMNLGQYERMTKKTVPKSPVQQAMAHHRIQLEIGGLELIAMSKAEGKDMADVAEGKAAGQSARALFGDRKHMKELGVLTALDIFMGNLDRVMSANLGNWFVDASNATQLIDNVNPDSRTTLKYGGTDVDDKGGYGANDTLQMLTSAKLAETAREAIDGLIDELRKRGDAGIDAWADEKVSWLGGTRRKSMREAFLSGLKEGRSRIIKTFTSKKPSKATQKLKGAADAAAAVDDRGDAPDYWANLVARAKFLAKN